MKLNDIPELVEELKKALPEWDVLFLFEPNRTVSDFAVKVEHPTIECSMSWYGVEQHTILGVKDLLVDAAKETLALKGEKCIQQN